MGGRVARGGGRIEWRKIPEIDKVNATSVVNTSTPIKMVGSQSMNILIFIYGACVHRLAL